MCHAKIMKLKEFLSILFSLLRKVEIYIRESAFIFYASILYNFGVRRIKMATLLIPFQVLNQFCQQISNQQFKQPQDTNYEFDN